MSDIAPWYTFNRIDNFGQIDPQRGANGSTYWKPDTNVLVPPGYPVIAVLSGIVTSVQYTDYGQTVITIKLDTPLNSLATHMYFEHMHDSTVSKGTRVQFGTLIGHANLAGEGASLGVGLYSGDVYGTGQAWNILQNDLKPGGKGLLNPVALIESLKNGLTIPVSNGTGIASTLSLTANNIHQTINNIPGFTGIVIALDSAEQFQPFVLKDTGGTQIGILGDIPIVGESIKNTANLITLPSDNIQALLTFLVANVGAFMIRSTIVSIGIIILIALIANAFSQVTGINVEDIAGMAL